MSAVKWFFRLLLVLTIAVVGIGFFLPETTRVQRETTIARPQAEVFAMLNSYRRFNEWSPWYPRDPDADYSFEGPDSGVGAAMRWSSRKREVGSGTQRIVASEPERRIEVALAFEGQGEAKAAYVLEPVADGTRVTWEFETRHGGNLISRWFGLAFDRMLGADYEAGLAKLKTVLESGAPAEATLPTTPSPPASAG